ncbi:hypothetical protein ACI79C_14155 [Geodermatophilus sp. SYSU D00697]
MSGSASWDLESFLDSLIVELDKAQDTLSVKGLTRRLTYTVRDVSLDMHIFPQFDGGQLRFAAAKPGETGASRIAIQLGSITDQQIKDVGNQPPRPDDVAIDVLPDIDPGTKRALRVVGVTTARDLDRLKEGDVDVTTVVADKAGTDFTRLSEAINRARRRRQPPRLVGAQSVVSGPRTRLRLEGRNLVAGDPAPGYPVVLVNGRPAEVIAADETHLAVDLPADALRRGANHVAVALDPYADFSCTVRG